MSTGTIEVRLTLSEDVVQRLRELAQAQGVSESSVVEEALHELGDARANDYWLSVAAMREDWEAMPDDWMMETIDDAVPPR